MRVQIIQHVPFEGPGCILKWIKKNKYDFAITKLFENYNFPSLNDFDFLIIMGGPMGVYDYDKFPWLKDEKNFIKKSIKNNKTILGICLGAQLIANVIGAKVYKNKFKEIGWFPIKKVEFHNSLFDFLKEELSVFHWHGDTFDLPKNSINFFESEGCKNQAFTYKEKILGLQFHLEVTKNSLNEMIKNGKNELVKDKFIQTEKEILQKENIKNCNKIMFGLLDKIS